MSSGFAGTNGANALHTWVSGTEVCVSQTNASGVNIMAARGRVILYSGEALL